MIEVGAVRSLVCLRTVRFSQGLRVVEVANV